MKKKNRNYKLKSQVSKKRISSEHLFALILCSIIGIGMICNSIYRHKKLSTNSEYIMAKITDIYLSYDGKRIWDYEMKYQAYLDGKTYIWTCFIEEKELDEVHVGDCIEVLVSLDDKGVQEWNREKGAFKCE